MPDLSNSPHIEAAGLVSNCGTRRYLLEAISTTGFMAWKLEDGTTLVSEAVNISLPPSPQVSFWACAGFKDTTPAGEVVALDCHDNNLTRLEIKGLTRLKFLDCSLNKLTELNVSGLSELQAIDADDNLLTGLEIKGLCSLRMLNCARNRIKGLDTEVLMRLEVVDISGNPMTTEKGNTATNAP